MDRSQQHFPFKDTFKITAYALAISVALSACGGGGGDANGTQAAQSLAAASPANSSSSRGGPDSGDGSDLLISEVATNYYSDDVAWLEVYNPRDTAVALSAYALRSGYLDASTGANSTVPATFELPAVDVPAKGYIVIAAKVNDKLRDNGQIVYVKNGSLTPYWNANGSLELVAAGKTVDFVRFGSSQAEPLASSAWSGANAPALPSDVNEHGKSIVRLAALGMPDTNRAADWTLVNFATPGGKNDIAAGVVDSDRDGIPDTAKVQGGTYAGLDLYAMGARAGRRDIFMEVDYMKGDDPALTPRKEALQKVVDAFAAKNIALHLDTGALHSTSFDPAGFNLGGGNAVDFAACVALDAAGNSANSGCASIHDYKSVNFDLRRKLMFHYALFANSLKANGGAGSSGVAEVLGNDLIVALGGNDFSTTPGVALNLLINLQASTLMHELGHNLGLRHGGNEDVNYKPNHYSVMNYMYQFAGLSATPSSVYAAERYYLAYGMKGKTYCNLTENSPCSDNFIIDYSNGSGADLDENRLSESSNIGRGSAAGAYADWNNDGVRSSGFYALNINPLNGYGRTVLKDYDEWSNIVLPFSRGSSGNNGNTFSEPTAMPRNNPMNELARERVEEEPLPAAFQSTLSRLSKEKVCE